MTRPDDDPRVEIIKPATGPAGPAGPSGAGPEVGFGPQPTPLTATMLARYLVGRAIASRVSTSLMVIGLAIVAGAVALWVWGPKWLAVLVGLIGLCVLAFRALVMALLRRLMAVGRLGDAEDRIRGLVGDTGSDLRRELKRIGLPSSTLGLPLLVIRLVGRRRKETFAKLTHFDIARVVPRSRMDELNFVVRNDVLGRPGGPTGV